MEEELGGTFVVAVDELGLNGLWSTVKDLVEARMPLQGLTLPNKVGKQVQVAKLPLMYVLSTDKRLLRLKQYSHSPVTWFRNPMTHLVLVSTADVHEYKSTTRAQLKRVTADIEKDWGGGAVGSEWLMLYVRPFELDTGDKGAKRVFEKLCDDFGSKRRERVVRLDVPLRAFDAPGSGASGSSSSSSSMRGSTARLAPGTFVGPGGTALAAGLEDLAAGLRDSIRAAFEARQTAYDAEVRRLLNERRDPKWSFTTLYLVKDSFALMLEGAGLWEDAFQEYVELETVYLDCLDAAAEGGPAAAGTGGISGNSVGSAGDFGLTGSESEDVASLLTSSWRSMRRLVLWKKRVQEFQFRQYLFAAQARVLLRLGRPVDVAERGLVFVQNFLALLAAKEAAGLIKPWFKECWAFSASMSLVTAVSSYVQRGAELPADWEVHDLMPGGGGPSQPAAQAAVRQMAAAVAAAAAADGVAGSSGSAGADRSKARPMPASPRGGSVTLGQPGPPASLPALPAACWELGSLDPDAAGRGGGAGGDVAGSSGAAAAAPEDEEVPPLDLALLCGRAILPGNVGLAQDAEQRRELMDRLYFCLLGHLFHLARGELLRIGTALRLPEAAAANASVLQLGKAAFAPASAGASSSGGTKAALDSASSSPTKPSSASKQQQQQRSSQGQTSAAAAASLTAGVDLLTQAAAAGSLSPRMVAQLQELLLTPLCGFSQMINKYADGSSGALTYEVHTPKLHEDPLAAALHRADSQSTPYVAHSAAGAAAGTGATNSPRNSAAGASPFGRSGSSSSTAGGAGAVSAAGAASGGGSSGSMFDRLRRVGSSGSAGNSPTAAAAAASGGSGQSAGGQQQQHSRLSKVTGEGGDEGGGSSSSSLRRQDSCTSLATVNINSTSADGGPPPGMLAAGGERRGGTTDGASADTAADVDDELDLSSISISGGVAAAAAAEVAASLAPSASLADSASSHAAVAGVQEALPPRSPHTRTMSAVDAHSSHSVGAGAGGQLHDPPVTLPKVATHSRSASAMAAPAAGDAAAAAAAAAAGSSGRPGPGGGGAAVAGGGGVLSPRRLEGLVDPGAIAAAPSASEQGLSVRRGAVQPSSLQPSAATAAAAMSVPGWVGEWRLQLALRSPACFQELVLALSHRAAWCYARAGRVRSSALIYADVAVLALQRGQLGTAARLLDRMQQIFGSEGWQLLQGTLLPKLLACQCLAAQPLLPFTAVRLLALQPSAAAAADRQAAFEELLTGVGAAAAEDEEGGGSSSRGGSSCSSSSTVQLATLSAVQMRPAPGTYSHFFGSEAWEAAGGDGSADSEQEQQFVPVLSPPARGPDQAAAGSSNASSGSSLTRGGAVLLAVGDSLSLAVDVISTLPGLVVLQRPLLSLVQLHKSSWISSSVSGIGSSSSSGSFQTAPAAGAPGGYSSSTSAAHKLGRSVHEASASKQGFAAVWDSINGGSANSPGTAAASVAGLQRWQEGDELLATKLMSADTPSSSSSSARCRLLQDGGVVLVPGLNRLVFRVAPVTEGLYCLKQLRGRLGACGELLIGMPPPGALSLLAAAVNTSGSRQRSGTGESKAESVLPAGVPAAAGGAGGSDVVQMGGVTSAGAVVSEVVVARVVAPAPRVRLTPVVPEGTLAVGSTTWLGVVVTPLRDAGMQRPRLHLQPSRLLALASASAAGGGSSGNGPRQQQQLYGGGSSSDEQQQSLLLAIVSGGQLAAGDSSSSSLGGLQLPGYQSLAHHVFVMPLQQQQEQQQAGWWLPVKRGCVDLSELQQHDGGQLLSRPLLVWMQVLVGSPVTSPATVCVAAVPAAPAAPKPAGPPASPAAAATAGPKVQPEPCLLLAGRSADAAAEMSLQLEYSADGGVWRSHSCSMHLPLQQPINITAQALLLPSGAVALSVTLSLNPGLHGSFILHEAGLRPQFGLMLPSEPGKPGRSSRAVEAGGSLSSSVQGSAAGFSDAVPLLIVPGGSAGLSFLLLPDPGDKVTGSFEADGCSMLLLSYSLLPHSAAASCTDPATGLQLPGPPSGAQQQQQQASGGSSAAEAAGASSVVAASMRCSDGGGGGRGTAAAVAGPPLTLRLPFWLEFPSVDEAAAAASASVRVTLLGQLVGRVGQQMTLSWQLARIKPTDAAAPDGDAAGGFASILLDAHAAEGQQQDATSRGAAQGQQAAEQDELLCFELLLGQQLQQEPKGSLSSHRGKAAAAAPSDSGAAGAGSAAFWGLSAGALSGVVRLGRAPGSLASVEVVVMPRGPGRMAAPQLLLKAPGGGSSQAAVALQAGAASMLTIF